MTITCLSVRQPFAWLIVSRLKERKDVENRSWRTNVRGWIGIHAGASEATAEQKLWIRRNFPTIAIPANLLKGRLIGFANLTDCVAESSSRWFVGDFGFLLPEAVPFDGPAFNGRLGFFRVNLSDDLQYPPPIHKLVVNNSK